MTHTIWRFDLRTTDETIVSMPQGARILKHVIPSDRIQNGVTLWAEVDPDEKLQPYIIRIYGTGHAVEPGQRYLGTYTVPGVVPMHFHVYEAR